MASQTVGGEIPQTFDRGATTPCRHDHGCDHRTPSSMGAPDHGNLSHVGVLGQGRFHFPGGYVFTTRDDDVIHAAEDQQGA